MFGKLCWHTCKLSDAVLHFCLRYGFMSVRKKLERFIKIKLTFKPVDLLLRPQKCVT